MTMIKISKEIWDFLMLHQITITAEYLPGSLNIKADWESRHTEDLAEWKLCPSIFNQISLRVGVPTIDLFASRLSHQVPMYYSWKADPYSIGIDAFCHNWDQKCLYAFPPFALIHRVLQKVEREHVPLLILITPTWQSQTWYPELLRLSVGNPFLLPLCQDLLKNPKGENHRW